MAHCKLHAARFYKVSMNPVHLHLAVSCILDLTDGRKKKARGSSGHCFDKCHSNERYPKKYKGITSFPFPKPKRKLEDCKVWIRACGRHTRFAFARFRGWSQRCAGVAHVMDMRGRGGGGGALSLSFDIGGDRVPVDLVEHDRGWFNTPAGWVWLITGCLELHGCD